MWRLPGVSAKRFFKDLRSEVKDDNVSNGAAALAYYLMLASFPAMIFLLSLLPFLPVANLDQAIMDALRQAMPGEAADLFEQTVQQVVSTRSGGLLSVGLVATFWAASNGAYAVMQQLNITYDVKEGRPFWKARGTALLLTLVLGALMVVAFALIVLGGFIQERLGSLIGSSGLLLFAFAALRWAIIASFLLLAFALAYYWGPDVEQDLRFITPGSLFGVVVLALAALGFRLYVSSFGKYSATYGSLGAVIVLLLWLYIMGWVILLGSEVNALVEHYKSEGKEKGEKRQPPGGGRPREPRRAPAPLSRKTPAPERPGEPRH